jgi:hypothetical protein
MLLVSLSLPRHFALPLERCSQWYGLSADTAGRGFAGLAERGLLEIRSVMKKAPLAPKGYTVHNEYRLLGTFARPVTPPAETNT